MPVKIVATVEEYFFKIVSAIIDHECNNIMHQEEYINNIIQSEYSKLLQDIKKLNLIKRDKQQQLYQHI